MKRLRNTIGVGAGKATGWTMRALGRSSTALPGYVAERIGRNPLRHYLRNRHYAKTILITGTNGKTTTTMLIAEVMKLAGLRVVNNRSGSNLTRGVLTALLADTRRGDDTVLLLEVDEASMSTVCQATNPDIIVVSNIFRDQLDRYGEVDTTRRLLRQAIELAPNAELVLCADDPHVASLALDLNRKVHYFGMNTNGIKALEHDHASDIPLSPITGVPLKYSRRYFGHVGVYRATDGSFSRPTPDVSVEDIDLHDSVQVVTFKLKNQSSKMVVKSPLLGVYNGYNLASAIMVALACNLDNDVIISALQNNSRAFGRQESITYQGRQCTFLLVKNPTGFNQVIQSFFTKPTNPPILIVINDNFADGRDVSWLWDVAIEDISTDGPIIVSGLRAYDMALRLKYADKNCRVIEDPMQAISELVQVGGDETIYILPTYTALLDIRKQLSLKLEHSS